MLFVDIMKVCMWSFEGVNIIHDRITDFRQLFYILEYDVCVNKFSHRFQWIFFKPAIHFADIMKMYMWDFDEAEIIFTELRPLKLGHCLTAFLHDQAPRL